MQIIYTIYGVNLLFLSHIEHSLQDFKFIDNMACFEANLTLLDFDRDIVNK